MLENPDVSWFTKLEIHLRHDWMIGALVAGYPGDPFLRSHRLLVLWAGVLIGMVCSRCRVPESMLEASLASCLSS